MNIDKILSELTLEEKASLCSGSDFWHTQPIERLDLPTVMVSDGPHGLRKNIDLAENPNQARTHGCFFGTFCRFFSRVFCSNDYCRLCFGLLI